MNCCLHMPLIFTLLASKSSKHNGNPFKVCFKRGFTVNCQMSALLMLSECIVAYRLPNVSVVHIWLQEFNPFDPKKYYRDNY